MPEPLRILHLISSLNPALGGPTEGLRQLTACYEGFGAKPFVATLDAPGAAFLELSHAQTLGLGPTRAGNFGYTSRLIPWLRQNARQFDAAVVHGLWQFHGAATWWVLHGGPIPYFVFPHGMLNPWFKNEYPLKHLKKSAYWWIVQHRALRDAAGVLFTC